MKKANICCAQCKGLFKVFIDKKFDANKLFHVPDCNHHFEQTLLSGDQNAK